jgi:hypothetical protein
MKTFRSTASDKAGPRLGGLVKNKLELFLRAANNRSFLSALVTF